jgi:uncharacterized protein (TIGR02679 family)
VTGAEPPDAAAALNGPGWHRLLAAARRSLERTGGRLEGSVSLKAPNDEERRVIIGISGEHRSTRSGRLRVRLAEIDEHLRAVYGTGLAGLLGPLRNRPAEIRRELEAREAALASAAAGRHARSDWYDTWVHGLRRDGTLTRLLRAGVPFVDAVRVLDALPADDEPMPLFADRVLGDTKALADGAVRGVVLRALAVWQQLPGPAGSEQERELWESVGVVPDDLASQVLALNVPASGGLLGSWLATAAAAGVPFRATLHQLRLAPLTVKCSEIFVCENPAVLRAAATALGRRCRPLICTEGAPSAATHALLRASTASVIRWRNDFDWPGVRLTAGALRRYPHAVPWRMSTADYCAAAADPGPMLIGGPADTPWEPALREAMTVAGHAVMEERLLAQLLGDLDAAR